MRQKHRRGLNRTALGHELLESRSLLAGIVGDALCSAWQNPLDANDLNGDGSVTAGDALVAINTINSGAGGDLSAKMAPPSLAGLVHEAASDFLDASGDGHLSAVDALAVINAINTGLPGGAIRNLPLEDQQGDTIDDTEPAVPTLEFGRGFARVLAAINAAGDVDVFKIVTPKTNLSVSLFSASRVPLTVSLVAVDPTAEGGIATLGTVTTEADSRRGAKLNVDVEAGGTYFLTVKAAAAADTGVYGLTVFNYSDDQFRPVTDSELGDDLHGGTAETATEVDLNRDVHAQVRSNIDAAGDVDAFAVEVNDGKLIVHGGAAFSLSIDIVQLDDAGAEVAGTKVSGARNVVANVTAGTYLVSVKAANDTDTGAYRLNVVNARIPRHIPHDPASALEALFARLDDNGDKALSKVEVKPGLPLTAIPALDRIFNDWDADDDGSLDFAEFEDGFENLHRRAPVQTPIRDFIHRIRRR